MNLNQLLVRAARSFPDRVAISHGTSDYCDYATLARRAAGLGGAMGPVLQTRLMDVAGESQTLAAALNHSDFNFANALGPLLGGLAIAGGHGWTSPGWVGTGLSLAGLAILCLSLWMSPDTDQSPAD